MTIEIDIDETLTKTAEAIKNYIVNYSEEFEDSKQLLNDVHHIFSRQQNN